MDFAAVDELFAQRFAEGLTPGLVYGVLREGELLHSNGFGTTTLDAETPPDVDSVFRIASMSKSFTAAALLLLRDRGLVDLDAPVAQYVPELVDQAPYSPDSPAVSLRQLLTMSAGLPTDDPWGDRQESLSYADFGTFLDGGFTPGRVPGTGFEYSNLGYALLGRVVENVTSVGSEPEGAHRAFVEAELLAPLGMTASAYAPEAVPRRVPGHVKRSDGWHELAPVAPGAFSAMGGLHSSIRDLTTWVSGFVSAFRGGPDAHPLSKASRREMQQLHRIAGVDASLAFEGMERGLSAVAHGYGFGLMVDQDARMGQFVHHTGGYPGYGSRMVWHPETGLGVVTLSNGTYAGAYDQAMTAARLLVSAEPDRWSIAVRGLRDRLDQALNAAVARLRTFDTEGEEPFADPALFADNVELDVPDAERRVQLREARSRVGLPLGDIPHGSFSPQSATALAVIPAERGRYDVLAILSPEREPRLQRLTATAVPDAPESWLTAAREALGVDGPITAAMRAFGEPSLLAAPVSCEGDKSVELLITAGPTYWKATVSGGESAGGPRVTLSAYPTAAYPRLSYLLGALG